MQRGAAKLRFKLRVSTDVEYASVITNQASVLFASQAGGTDFFCLARDSSTVTIVSRRRHRK
jgi:hypothetical protein